MLADAAGTAACPGKNVTADAVASLEGTYRGTGPQPALWRELIAAAQQQTPALRRAESCPRSAGRDACATEIAGAAARRKGRRLRMAWQYNGWGKEAVTSVRCVAMPSVGDGS